MGSGSVAPGERYYREHQRYYRATRAVLPWMPTVLPLIQEQYYRNQQRQPDKGGKKTEEAPRKKEGIRRRRVRDDSTQTFPTRTPS